MKSRGKSFSLFLKKSKSTQKSREKIEGVPKDCCVFEVATTVNACANLKLLFLVDVGYVAFRLAFPPPRSTLLHEPSHNNYVRIA